MRRQRPCTERASLDPAVLTGPSDHLSSICEMGTEIATITGDSGENVPNLVLDTYKLSITKWLRFVNDLLFF